MAEAETPFGNISIEDVYGIIGRLYTQLWAATNQTNEMSQGLALANERNHALEIALNKNNLDGLFKQEAGVPLKEKSEGPLAPKAPTVVKATVKADESSK